MGDFGDCKFVISNKRKKRDSCFWADLKRYARDYGIILPRTPNSISTSPASCIWKSSQSLDFKTPNLYQKTGQMRFRQVIQERNHSTLTMVNARWTPVCRRQETNPDTGDANVQPMTEQAQVQNRSPNPTTNAKASYTITKCLATNHTYLD